MNATLANNLLQGLNPLRLAGPIFDKELRVSSRRRRNYSLRFFYIAILAFFVVTVWMSRVDVQGNATVQQSRMAEAGKAIVRTVVLFQFVATQILAVVLLCNAISDEIYHRTLGLLMTTPINSFQIVMGKLLSRLLQLVQLLAITFPILAIVRVLGGVSWGYLFSSMCITLTAAIFAGSVSLLLSINNRRSYVVILQTLFLLASFYFIVPMVIGALWGRGMTGVSMSSFGL
ncbi:MAG TPA: ABC transporter permease subunit, partial [Sedimentisphaerales bacterium]|nr:ABC transporter permease subunit [Sedimentisphaerales bacterium]